MASTKQSETTKRTYTATINIDETFTFDSEGEGASFTEAIEGIWAEPNGTSEVVVTVKTVQE